MVSRDKNYLTNGSPEKSLIASISHLRFNVEGDWWGKIMQTEFECQRRRILGKERAKRFQRGLHLTRFDEKEELVHIMFTRLSKLGSLISCSFVMFDK